MTLSYSRSPPPTALSAAHASEARRCVGPHSFQLRALTSKLRQSRLQRDCLRHLESRSRSLKHCPCQNPPEIGRGVCSRAGGRSMRRGPYNLLQMRWHPLTQILERGLAWTQRLERGLAWMRREHKSTKGSPHKSIMPIRAHRGSRPTYDGVSSHRERRSLRAYENGIYFGEIGRTCAGV
jgi:hypothetical protein